MSDFANDTAIAAAGPLSVANVAPRIDGVEVWSPELSGGGVEDVVRNRTAYEMLSALQTHLSRDERGVPIGFNERFYGVNAFQFAIEHDRSFFDAHVSSVVIPALCGFSELQMLLLRDLCLDNHSELTHLEYREMVITALRSNFHDKPDERGHATDECCLARFAFKNIESVLVRGVDLTKALDPAQHQRMWETDHLRGVAWIDAAPADLSALFKASLVEEITKPNEGRSLWGNTLGKRLEPSYHHLKLADPALIESPRWYVRFTPFAEISAREGFTRGTPGLLGLGLTLASPYEEASSEPGYNFAVETHNRSVDSACHRYGRVIAGAEAVIFRTGVALRVQHAGDYEQDQVVFWGPAVPVEDIIPIRYWETDWRPSNSAESSFTYPDIPQRGWYREFGGGERSFLGATIRDVVGYIERHEDVARSQPAA